MTYTYVMRAQNTVFAATAVALDTLEIKKCFKFPLNGELHFTSRFSAEKVGKGLSAEGCANLLKVTILEISP